ncbi:MAG: SdpI family protein [Saprospiraceae bacterium]|nr:SdpI family protein [Saprospiraceae bacterium]
MDNLTTSPDYVVISSWESAFICPCHYFLSLTATQINNLHGYRSRNLMKLEQTWKIANEYSVNLLLWISIFLNIIQALLFVLVTRQLALVVVSFLIPVLFSP